MEYEYHGTTDGIVGRKNDEKPKVRTKDMSSLKENQERKSSQGMV